LNEQDLLSVESGLNEQGLPVLSESSLNVPVGGLRLRKCISLGKMVQTLLLQCRSVSKPPICRITALAWICDFVLIEENHSV